MEQLNKVELRGKIGSVRIGNFGDQTVAHLSVATNYVYKTKDGTPAAEITWHNVTAWKGMKMPDFSFLKKGTGIYVCGRIKNTKYISQDGSERSSSEVIASEMSLVEDNLTSECSF
ncbi:MAG: single-stranded DNA-binding protein [Bacteroidales bacterium]|nr:single-stranded DNA-binding protein [Bacteroidales bacterium]